MLLPVHESLYPYQVYGAEWLSGLPEALLADEPGAGKTGQAIVACDHVKAKNILVLCPGVARAGWEQEFLKFSNYKRSIGIITTTAKGVPDTEVIIASYSIIGSREVLIKLLSRAWDVLICDEAHFLKNPHSLRSKVVYGAKTDRQKGLASKAKRVWLLTGTPIPNSLMEMYPHMRALFPHAIAGYERESSFRDHFCVTDSGGIRVVSNKNVPDFINRMKPYVLRRRLEDVLPDLPPVRITQVIVDPDKLPPKSKEERESELIVNNAIAQVNGDLTEAALSDIQRLAGMHTASVRKWTGIAKAHAVAELIKADFESGMDKVVIFALHRQVFEILLKELPGSKAIHGGTPMVQRDQLINIFQGRVAGEKLDILLCHVDIASTALTLTASAFVYHAETTWRPMDLWQATKRCHRFGQTRPVLAKVVSLKGSIDEAVGSVLTRKAQSISKVETALTTKEGIE